MKVILVLLLVLAIVPAVYAQGTTAPPAKAKLQVQSVALGDDLINVFVSLGAPQAVQVIGGGDDPAFVQLVYFRGEGSLMINITDLPDNTVAEIEMSGVPWNTNSPVKVGDSVDKAIAAIGKPDNIEDLTQKKNWMMEQAGNDETVKRLLDKSSGDSAVIYNKLGIYAEYDKDERIVKSVRIFNMTFKTTPQSVHKS